MDHVANPPGLETVEVRSHGAVVALSTFLVMTFAMAGSLVRLTWRYHSYLGKQASVTYAVLAVVLALCLWIVYRLLTQVYYWRSDVHGLTMSGVLGRTLIRWDEVLGAEVIEGSVSGRGYRLRTKTRAITVRDVHGTNSMDLCGSIWLHLHHRSGMEGLQPLGTAKSVRDEIPPEVSAIGSWTNPRPPRMWHLCVMAVVVCSLAALLVGDLVHEREIPPMLSLAAALGFLWGGWSLGRERLSWAVDVGVGDSSLSVTLLRRRVTIAWSDVTSACWRRNPSDMSLYLLIRGLGSGSEVAIPWIASDAQSSKLMLAVVERLRASGRGLTIAIPEGLRSQPTPDDRRAILTTAAPDPGERITLRLSTHNLVAFTLGPALFLTDILVLALGMADDHRLSPAALPILLGLMAVLFWLSWSSSISLDGNGVTVRSVRRRKRVGWGEVASYSIRRSADGSSGAPTYQLRDASGAITMEVSLAMRGKRQREAFESALLSRLSSIPVFEDPAESWRARPHGDSRQ